MNAIQAKGAIEVSDLAGQEKAHLAATAVVVAAEAIMRCAARANRGFPHLDLEGRDQRADKMKLADRADEFAEAGPAEQGIHHECGREIAKNEQGGR